MLIKIASALMQWLLSTCANKLDSLSLHLVQHCNVIVILTYLRLRTRRNLLVRN